MENYMKNPLTDINPEVGNYDVWKNNKKSSTANAATEIQ
jgi:hypothetical protein